MVSTFLSYNIVSRDLQRSLDRVAKQTSVSKEAEYYKANIGKVKSVDDFMKDARIYNYAVKAYGLEDMAYAKAFIRKVLESDLSDDNSFANKLTDKRYRDFAASFNFNTATTIAQTSSQIDKMLGLYSATMTAQEEGAGDETRYFNAMMGQLQSADQLLSDDRLRNYLLTSFKLDTNNYSRDFLKGVLTSDPNDPNSYINQQIGTQKADLQTQIDQLQAQVDASTDPDQRVALRNRMFVYMDSLEKVNNYYDMASAFSFNSDGTVPAGGAQTAQQMDAMNSRYYSNQPRLSTATATNEDTYFKSKIGSITSVDQLSTDTRLFAYIRTAFDLTDTFWDSIKSALTSDLNDPNSPANLLAKTNPGFLDLAKAFNFNTDGTVAAGNAQNATQAAQTSSNYFARYNDIQDEADERAVTLYKTAMGRVKTVDEFLASTDAYQFSLKAVGLDPNEVSSFTVKQVLQSDLSDPNSYVNQLKDDRYLTLAKAFNFGKDGNPTAPLTAQSSATITTVGSRYTVAQTRFLTGTELTDAKAKAKEELTYYTKQITGIESASQFLGDSRLVNVVLKAYGLDPKTATPDFLKQLFASDLSDPKSFANQQKNTAWAEMVGAFNFDAKGNLSRQVNSGIQSRGKIIETENNFERLTLEEEQGNENNGVRLALYFDRKAKDITSPFDILGDTALLEFFRVTFQMPESFGSMNVDKQAALVKSKLDLASLQDPEKVKKLVSRFTALYDLQNTSASASALSLLTSSGSASISADLLSSLQK